MSPPAEPHSPREAPPPTPPRWRTSHLWAALFLFSTAAIAALKLSEAIDSPVGFILFAASMFLLVPMIRAMAHERTGRGSAAGVAYARRMAFFAMLYIVDLGIAIAVDRSVGVRGWYTVLFALLPTLPILGMIWAMGRYLIEETDEFQRYRSAMAALIGLGVLLALATFAGFLEQFGLNLHPQGWLALPVWAVGMGVGRLWLARRDREGAEE